MRFRGLKANFWVQDFSRRAGGARILALPCGSTAKSLPQLKRTARMGDFRSNLHRGGTAQVVRITKLDARPPCARRGPLVLGKAGVDLLRSDSGPKVPEVNSSARIRRESRESTGKDIVGSDLWE